MTLESLARTIAKARHGTDAHWPHYVGVAEAVIAELIAAAETAEPNKDDLFSHFYRDSDGLEDNHYLEPEESRIAFRALLRAIIASRPASSDGGTGPY